MEGLNCIEQIEERVQNGANPVDYYPIVECTLIKMAFYKMTI